MARKCSAERVNQLTGGFASAKKNISIQYQGKEIKESVLLSDIRRAALDQGMKEEEIGEVDIYIKPEEQVAYYVINKTVEGSISL